MLKKIKQINKFYKDKFEYNKQNTDNRFMILNKNVKRYYDWDKQAGDIDEHYFFMDFYIAKQVLNNHTSVHYDIGSRLDGFVAHVLTQINVVMIDVRPLNFNVEGLEFLQGNACQLPLEDSSISSLSSLHALEHFGLGRYGDPVDPDAWKKALDEMVRVLKPNGLLYLAVPIANRDVLHFNAHRVFNPITIIKQVLGAELLEFRYIKNMNISKPVIEPAKEDYGEYSCGLFIFRKKQEK